jgi:hypothetical protein
LAAAMTAPATPIYGPEPWRTNRKVVWSYWDLWFCVVTVADHDGDLVALAAAIEDGGRSLWSSTVEAKLSHLDDLRLRLTEAGINAAKLVGDAEADPRVRGRARTKVLKQGLYPRDLTDAMRHTPRDRPYERALRGGWPLFRSHPSRSTSGSRTGSATGTGPRARRFASSAGSRPPASALTATPPRTQQSGTPPAAHCSRSATRRWNAAMTPTA